MSEWNINQDCEFTEEEADMAAEIAEVVSTMGKKYFYKGEVICAVFPNVESDISEYYGESVSDIIRKVVMIYSADGTWESGFANIMARVPDGTVGAVISLIIQYLGYECVMQKKAIPVTKANIDDLIDRYV